MHPLPVGLLIRMSLVRVQPGEPISRFRVPQCSRAISANLVRFVGPGQYDFELRQMPHASKYTKLSRAVQPTLRAGRSRSASNSDRLNIPVIAAAGTGGVLPLVEDQRAWIVGDIVEEERVVHAHKAGREY